MSDSAESILREIAKAPFVEWRRRRAAHACFFCDEPAEQVGLNGDEWRCDHRAECLYARARAYLAEQDAPKVGTWVRDGRRFGDPPRAPWDCECPGSPYLKVAEMGRCPRCGANRPPLDDEPCCRCGGAGGAGSGGQRVDCTSCHGTGKRGP